ncbi:MAG TPA: recombinase family protein [Verrucomicrobiales bacterium]|nr:recombinase family protein [Verrucomicrobiales bacterium]
MSNIKKAVIYCRVSTKEQVEEGNSLITQERICRDYCQKNGYEVSVVFLEQGESAKTADRTELRKLLSHCANRKNDTSAVIIYKLDRLSRNTDDYSQIRLLLKRYGVEIRSTSEHFENTPVGRFMENTIANVAQFDNDIRTERSVGGMKEAMREGRYVWRAPVGYDNVRCAGKTTIQPNRKNGPLVRKAFEMVASRTHSIEDVRRALVREGLASRDGKPVSRSYFPVMLTNEIYAGWIVKFGERHRGLFEPVISDDLFQKVQRVLKGKGLRTHALHRTDNPDFPLRRFVVDSNGRKLTGSWSRGRNQKYAYYRFGGKDSNHHRDHFEEQFVAFLESFSFDAEQFSRLRELVYENLVKATADKRKDAARLEHHIKELTERQTGVIRKNLGGIIPDVALKQQLELIEEELSASHEALSGLAGPDEDYEAVMDLVEEYLRHPGKVWREASLEVKTRLQWFEFPLGVVFENHSFRTAEICSIFNVKEEFSGSKSSSVRLRVGFWNQLGMELRKLAGIIGGEDEREADRDVREMVESNPVRKRVWPRAA